MGVNGADDIAQPRPHFQSQGKARCLFRDGVTDRLNAKNFLIILAGGDANEAIIARLGHRATIGCQGKLTDQRLDPFGLRL